MSKDELLSHFCKTPSIWGEHQNTPCSGFAKGPRFLNMVMTFVLTPLSHYSSIIEPRIQFLLSLLEDLTIDFPSHFITSIIDVYQDMETRDKLIFHHFSIPILDSPYYTIIGAISAASIRWSEAQLQPKWPRTESIDLATFAFPSTSAPSSLDGGVTFKAIMA